MSTDQIAEATLQAMNIQTAAVVIQTLLGLAAIFLAFREVRKWRVETLGNKKIDLALRLGSAAIALRDAFRTARLPVGTVLDKSSHQTKVDLAPEMIRAAQEERYNQRLEIISDKLTRLYEIRWEVSVLFDEPETIVKHVERYNIMFHQLQSAMKAEFEGKGTEDTLDLLYASKNSKDKFTLHIESVTDDLLAFARKYTR